MEQRPLYHQLMLQEEIFAQYQADFSQFLAEYLESGRCEAFLRTTQKLIAPYVRQDPTAFCSYADHQKAVDTLLTLCQLRGESARGQLEDRYPATLAQQEQSPGLGVSASLWTSVPWETSTTWKRQNPGRTRPWRPWPPLHSRKPLFLFRPPAGNRRRPFVQRQAGRLCKSTPRLDQAGRAIL